MSATERRRRNEEKVKQVCDLLETAVNLLTGSKLWTDDEPPLSAYDFIEHALGETRFDGHVDGATEASIDAAIDLLTPFALAKAQLDEAQELASEMRGWAAIRIEALQGRGQAR